jgi:hypothetical protein
MPKAQKTKSVENSTKSLVLLQATNLKKLLVSTLFFLLSSSLLTNVFPFTRQRQKPEGQYPAGREQVICNVQI